MGKEFSPEGIDLDFTPKIEMGSPSKAALDHLADREYSPGIMKLDTLREDYASLKEQILDIDTKMSKAVEDSLPHKGTKMEEVYLNLSRAMFAELKDLKKRLDVVRDDLKAYGGKPEDFPDIPVTH